MNIKPVHGTCKGCGDHKRIYNKSRFLCAGCYKYNRAKVYQERSQKRPQKPKKHKIKNATAKQLKLLSKYRKIRDPFMRDPKNKFCPVTGQLTTDVHHKKGKIGYADEWARINDIPLLLDVRFFLAVSRKGHEKIETNPEWAKKNGYSIDRLKDEN